MGPLVPRPVVVLIALGIVGLMFMNIRLDAGSATYDGGQTTVVLALLVAGILGFELFRPGGRK